MSEVKATGNTSDAAGIDIVEALRKWKEFIVGISSKSWIERVARLTFSPPFYELLKFDLQRSTYNRPPEDNAVRQELYGIPFTIEEQRQRVRYWDRDGNELFPEIEEAMADNLRVEIRASMNLFDGKPTRRSNG